MPKSSISVLWSLYLLADKKMILQDQQYILKDVLLHGYEKTTA